ncbi:MAG: hypothetical protein WA982_05470 [Rubrobacteraceae bacterium]
MPPNSRRYVGNRDRLPGTIWNTSLLAILAMLLFSCGQGEAQSTAVDVKLAEWRGESVLVSGVWARGVSTPPICRILESRDGTTSSYFEPDARVVLDGNTFSKQFVPAETAREGPPTKRDDLYVRCSVSMDSGRTGEDVAKVNGSS